MCKFFVLCECCIPQKEGKALHTHKGPRGFLSQIDRQKYRNSIQDCQALTFRPFESDHRLLVALARLSLRSTQPKRASNQRHDWTSLKNPATLKSFRITCQNRYAELVHADTHHTARYSAFVSAVTVAAKENLPVVNPSKKRVPWKHPNVRDARKTLGHAKSANRRRRTDSTLADVASASLALACQYTTNQEQYISSQIDRIQAADESRKPSEVWRTINELTGRKYKACAKIKAANPKARLAGWKGHFQKLLNNECPPLTVSFFVQSSLYFQRFLQL